MSTQEISIFIILAIIALIVLHFCRKRSVRNPHSYTNKRWLKKNEYWELALAFSEETNLKEINASVTGLYPYVILGKEMFAIKKGNRFIKVLPYEGLRSIYDETNTVYAKRVGPVFSKRKTYFSYYDGCNVATPTLRNEDHLFLLHFFETRVPYFVGGIRKDGVYRKSYDFLPPLHMNAVDRLAIGFTLIILLVFISFIFSFLPMRYFEFAEIIVLGVPFVLLMLMIFFLKYRESKREKRRKEIRKQIKTYKCKSSMQEG